MRMEFFKGKEIYFAALSENRLKLWHAGSFQKALLLSSSVIKLCEFFISGIGARLSMCKNEKNSLLGKISQFKFLV